MNSVPKLRFPEFRDNGEWEEKQMNDVAPLQRGFDLPSYLLKPGSVPVVYSNGIQKFHNEGKAQGPGIVTGRSGTIGNIHFIKEGDYWPHNTTLWVTSFKENCPAFIYYLYKSIGINQFVSGSGVPTLNRNYVHAYQVHLPQSFLEQQKIADCFTSIDELIETQTKKVEALKNHKKALMQQLFPQEGESVPKLRFPEFRDNGEWEEFSLFNISNITTGNSNREDSISQGGKYTFFDRSEDIRTSNRYLFDNEAIIVAGEGQQFIPKYFKGKFDLHQRTYAVIDLHIIGKFLYFYIYQNKNYFLDNAVGSTVKSLRLPMFKNMKINLPTLPEQQKIADCLSCIDELINIEKEKIESLKKHKKGLMQQLFPSEETSI